MAIITTNSQHYTNIADQLRDKTGTKDEFYPYEMAEKIETVYEAGKSGALDAVWEAIQAGGERTNYSYGFRDQNWNKDTFKPKYDIRLSTNGAVELFTRCPVVTTGFAEADQLVMKDVEAECGMVFDFSAVNNFTRTFSGALFKELNVIDITASTTSSQMAYTFYGGYLGERLRLQRIERFIVAETNVFATSTFQLASKLTYVGFEGVIANTLNVSWSPLVPESMKKAILCLKNYAGTDKEFAYSIKFDENCWTALEADSKAPDGGTWENYVTSLGWLT